MNFGNKKGSDYDGARPYNCWSRSVWNFVRAHAKRAGINYVLIGYPMDFWQNKMPSQMFIRTELQYSNLSDPYEQYTMDAYQREKELKLTYPLSRKTFVDYAHWFIDKTNIDVTEDLVTEISEENGRYLIKTEQGAVYGGKNVVISVGLTNAAYIPEPFSVFSKSHVTHTSDHISFDQFKNMRVLVVGGGQSGWEAAGLLHQAGASTVLSYRRHERVKARKGINKIQREIADKFYSFPEDEKNKCRRKLKKPAVSDFLVPFVEGKVEQRPGTHITKLEKTADSRLKVYFHTNETLIVDHIITATGYKYSLRKLPFLQNLIEKIELAPDQTPKVNKDFESTLPGIYFTGPSTVYSHGPTFEVIAGVDHTSRVIINSLASGN